MSVDRRRSRASGSSPAQSFNVSKRTRQPAHPPLAHEVQNEAIASCCSVRSPVLLGLVDFPARTESIMQSLGFLRPVRALRISTKLPVLQARHFHPTRPSPFINEVLAVSTSFLYGVHSLSGLPWVLSLPLSAVIVRMTVGLPLQIYTKLMARREQEIAPLLLSWSEYDKAALFSKARDTELSRMDPLRAMIAVRKKMGERRRALRKQWKIAPYYPYVNFLSIPVWIAVMDGLRQMSGIGQGLMLYLTNMVTRLPAQALAFLAGTDLSSTPMDANLPIESTMASEGALWFPDLLAGDATGILPALLAASVIMNVRTGWKVSTFQELDKLSPTAANKQFVLRLLRMFIQVLAVSIGASAYAFQMPTALLLYWITSSNIATLQTFLLQKYMFRSKPLKLRERVYIDYRRPGSQGP